MERSLKFINVAVMALIVSLLMSVPVLAADKSFEGKADIGGYSLYAKYSGEGVKPTIIFESGYGSDHTYWTNIQDEFDKKGYRTLSYDRAGLGLSDASPLQRTALNQTHELHKLLEVLKINGPYIFVAHSIGVYNTRVFAAEYPNEVKGVVITDGTPENIFPKLLEFLGTMDPMLPELYKASYIYEGSFDDCIQSAEQVVAAGNSLQKTPITILSGTNQGMGPAFDEFWMGFQYQMVNISNESKHILVNSGHNIPLENPQAVIEAIDNLISRVEDNN